MLVIGLTGGIGSGKSTVASLFEKHGTTIIDTDQLSRDLTQPNQPALQKMVDHFGADILQADGSLNRTLLRKIIFNNETERRWLENLLHPLIRNEMERLIKSAKTPYCIVVIPLLLETKPNPLIDRVLVVDALEEHQLQRAHARDKTTRDEISAIIRSQISRDQRLKAANEIIENHGSLKDLEQQVVKLHEFYTKEAQTKK